MDRWNNRLHIRILQLRHCNQPSRSLPVLPAPTWPHAEPDRSRSFHKLRLLSLTSVILGPSHWHISVLSGWRDVKIQQLINWYISVFQTIKILDVRSLLPTVLHWLKARSEYWSSAHCRQRYCTDSKPNRILVVSSLPSTVLHWLKARSEY